MNSNQAARAIGDVEKGTILASVEIAVAPERVFAALFEADDVMRWWGSDDTYRTTEWQADVRPGGKWSADGKSKDGSAFRVEGEFVEVDAPRRASFTWRADWEGSVETRVTYLLEPTESGTKLTLRHEGFGGRAASCNAHTSGWQAVLGWLAADLAHKAAPAQYFLMKLHGPRATFPGDMTDDERAMMMRHVAYWSGKVKEGKMIAFGPVVEAGNTWGMGVLRISDAAELASLTANDPASLANIGFRYETFPMPRAVHI